MVSAYIAQVGGCNLQLLELQKPEQKINSSQFAAVVAANGKDERRKGASCMAEESADHAAPSCKTKSS
jgi:hypothetical protein